MDDGSGINFGDALKYPGLEFVEGLDSDMAKKAACHFAKQGFDDVEPRAMPGRQDVLKTVGARGEKRPRLFGNVCGMIVRDYADGDSGGYQASRSESRLMNSRLRWRSSTRAVMWPSWRSSAASIEHVPSLSYS